MLIHNTTYSVDKSANSLFLFFMKENYIPRAQQGGLFGKPRLLAIKSHVGDDTCNYSLQFETESMAVIDQWFELVGDNINRTLTFRFGNEVLGFVTILEEVNIK